MKTKVDVRSRPVRALDWIEREVEREDGGIALHVVKFKGRIGRGLCKLMGRPPYFEVNLDAIGSFIWRRCDGEHTVGVILNELEREFGDDRMKERLYYYLVMLEKHDYITLQDGAV
jgi:hypothetical protein